MGTFARNGFINRVTEMVNRLYYLCCNLAFKSSLSQVFSCEPPTPSPTLHLPPPPQKNQSKQLENLLIPSQEIDKKTTKILNCNFSK